MQDWKYISDNETTVDQATESFTKYRFQRGNWTYPISHYKSQPKRQAIYVTSDEWEIDGMADMPKSTTQHIKSLETDTEIWSNLRLMRQRRGRRIHDAMKDLNTDAKTKSNVKNQIPIYSCWW